MNYYVYITANRQKDLFYIDFTSDLQGRMKEHQRGAVGPAYKSGCNELLNYEEFEELGRAKGRAFQLRNWDTQWILNLINRPSRKHSGTKPKKTVMDYLWPKKKTYH